MTADVTAVLVNYNAGEDLREALASVAEAMGGRPWEAIIVDNASTDGSPAIVGEFSPRARLVQNTRNVGFARAVNQALAQAQAPFILLMNPDCRIQPGAIERLQDELRRHPSCAIAGPRILDPDGTEQGSARGDPDMWTGFFGRSTALQRLFPALRVSTRNVVPSSSVPKGGSLVVDWLSGACMLARATALRKVGGFDERYFLYWEDADLCRRLRIEGQHVRYVPSATAVHKVGRSSSTARAASIRAFHQSAYCYYATHVAPGALNPKRPLARALLAFRCWWRIRHQD